MKISPNDPEARAKTEFDCWLRFNDDLNPLGLANRIRAHAARWRGNHFNYAPEKHKLLKAASVFLDALANDMTLRNTPTPNPRRTP